MYVLLKIVMISWGANLTTESEDVPGKCLLK